MCNGYNSILILYTNFHMYKWKEKSKRHPISFFSCNTPQFRSFFCRHANRIMENECVGPMRMDCWQCFVMDPDTIDFYGKFE